MKNSKTQKPECGECGAASEELEEFDGRRWCRNCLTENTTICADCDERIYREEATYVNDCPICERCYDDNYFQCEGCGERHHQDDYGEDGCCRFCTEDGKPTSCPDNQRYYSRSRRDLPVGVEIEAEGGDYYDVYDELAGKGFGVQGDGSLSDSGIEIQVPASNKGRTARLVHQACQSLKENGFDISTRCGMHIHIEYTRRMKTIKRLLLMVYACEPVLYAINPESRQRSSFCQPLSKAFSVHEIARTEAKELDRLFYSKKYPGLAISKAGLQSFKKSKWNACRYFGFNLHSLFYQRTVEFRYHAGTISPSKIMRWIKLLKGILLYVRFNYNQGEILRLIEQPTVLGKIKNLKQMLKLDEPMTDYLVNRYIKFRKQYVWHNLR